MILRVIFSIMILLLFPLVVFGAAMNNPKTPKDKEQFELAFGTCFLLEIFLAVIAGVVALWT